MNPNLGPQWNHPIFKNPKFQRALALSGGYQASGTTAEHAERVKKAGQFVPRNDDGMTVIAHDARADGRPVAWQRRYEQN